MPPRRWSGRVGRLVYMTCSLLRAENEDQVAAFSTAPRMVAGPSRLDTPLTASDGFFTAELRRRAGLADRTAISRARGGLGAF
jgi:hypothetical protein